MYICVLFIACSRAAGFQLTGQSVYKYYTNTCLVNQTRALLVRLGISILMYYM